MPTGSVHLIVTSEFQIDVKLLDSRLFKSSELVDNKLTS
jgi:hypothetical protein